MLIKNSGENTVKSPGRGEQNFCCQLPGNGGTSDSQFSVLSCGPQVLLLSSLLGHANFAGQRQIATYSVQNASCGGSRGHSYAQSISKAG